MTDARVRGRRVRRLLAAIALALIGAVAAFWVYAHAASLAPLDARASTSGTVVLAGDGTVLFRGARDGLRIPVDLDAVAPLLIEATLAAEDQRFFAHPGVDPLAIARALVASPGASGASTLTQQLARRVYLEGDASPLPVRKAREALLALQLEARYSKRELLAAYLNEVYYGHGAYGIEAAARTYFGVPAARLTLAQASLLAGLPQRPAGYDPYEHEAAALARREYVLERLVANDVVTELEASRVLEAPLALVPNAAPPLAPHFARYVLDEVARLAPDLAGRPGLIIETTLEAGLQREAERAVRVRLAALERHQATGAAVVALEPASGAIVALVGGPDFEAAQHGQVNLALAPRQPGSALKPFIYAAALERGDTAASTVLDVPTSFESLTGVYAPINYDQRFHGPVTLREALASSLNVPAVRTLDSVGVDALLELARRVGLGGLEAAEVYGLALALGGGEVSPLDLTAAYGVLANAGRTVEPHAIARIRDAHGAVLYEHAARPTRQALSPGVAFLITDILADPTARLLGFGAGSILDTPLPAAVKTGTSSAFRDNWTVGYTAGRVVGVWVGNANGAPMRDISGVDGAAPIWRDVIEAATDGRAPARFEVPSGLVRAAVCAPTGLRPGADCPSPVEEWFLAGTEPAAIERYYATDSRGLVAARPAAEAQAWGIAAGARLAATEPATDGAVTVVQPAPGSVLHLAPELPNQELLLRASVPVGAEAVEFALDGRVIARLAGDDARLPWNLEPGAHVLRVTAYLAGGRSVAATSTYTVVAADAAVAKGTR